MTESSARTRRVSDGSIENIRSFVSPRAAAATADNARWEPLAFACGTFHLSLNSSALTKTAGE